MITKAQAIRNCADDPSLSNQQVIRAVLKKYGIEVCTRDVIGQLGSYRSRKLKGPQGRHDLKTAANFLGQMGSVRHAVRMVHLAASTGGAA